MIFFPLIVLFASAFGIIFLGIFFTIFSPSGVQERINRFVYSEQEILSPQAQSVTPDLLGSFRSGLNNMLSVFTSRELKLKDQQLRLADHGYRIRFDPLFCIAAGFWFRLVSGEKCFWRNCAGNCSISDTRSLTYGEHPGKAEKISGSIIGCTDPHPGCDSIRFESPSIPGGHRFRITGSGFGGI